VQQRRAQASQGDDNGSWWPTTTVVDWVFRRDPTLTVEQIFDKLEYLCEPDRVKAQGRLHVYSVNQKISLNHFDVESFSEQYSLARKFYQHILMYEWRDLTFFPLLAIQSGETWEAAVAREFARPPGPRMGLRSKSLDRLVYSDPQFSRDDVIREWPELRGAINSTESEPTASSDIDGPKKRTNRVRRGNYFGSLEQFIARKKSEVLARMSDDAVARQFEFYCEELKRAGTPAPPLPSDRRNIVRQVGKIRERLAASNTNRAAGTTLKTR
jgi:hypothetical protein